MNITARNAQAEAPLIFVPGTVSSWPMDYFAGMADTSWDILNKKLPRGMLSFRSVILKNMSYIILEAWERLEDAPELMTTETCGERFCIDPIAGVYLDYFKALKAQGLKKDRDWFIFGYDTLRVGIEENAARLYEYILHILEETGAERVRLAGHSQGCLIIRQLVQETCRTAGKRDGLVSSFCLIAPPNRGVVNIYLLREGGIFNEMLAIRPASAAELRQMARDDISLDMTTTFLACMEGGGAGCKPEFIQDYMQSIARPVNQMLPVFPYLKKRADGSTEKWEEVDDPEHYPDNPFLKRLNRPESIARMTACGPGKSLVLYGTGLSSPEWITLGEKIPDNGRWRQGTPVSVDYSTQSDGLVLTKSVFIPGTEEPLSYIGCLCRHSGFFKAGTHALDILLKFSLNIP
ncbi:MAG TPA: hypothetical protein DD727_09065 [Clostridiales bacterium]|nr:hypothetical protein [Clostridiales bacterium]